jgi:hypothetical protein
MQRRPSLTAGRSMPRCACPVGSFAADMPAFVFAVATKQMPRSTHQAPLNPTGGTVQLRPRGTGVTAWRSTLPTSMPRKTATCYRGAS